ncbi:MULTISPECIES: hypothetical protein [unclassified Burkholderia]|uniref:hypothetical protein n=1 Tax=unclassified Burkholderia TaxID=2613784 RepID=UPI002AB07400|nr:MULTISPECIES: hypothetical protein [unclassified Burkholderia]
MHGIGPDATQRNDLRACDTWADPAAGHWQLGGQSYTSRRKTDHTAHHPWLIRPAVDRQPRPVDRPPFRPDDERDERCHVFCLAVLLNRHPFTRRSKPAGCLIVLSALHPAERSDTVRQMLIAMREQTVAALRARPGKSVATGEISAHANLDAIARYYVTVRQGMSIQARDGASRRNLEAVAQAALAAWPALAHASCG